MKKHIGIAMAVLLSLSLCGCGYLLAGGAGAAGGYVLRDKGYVVQSPVKKESKTETQSKKNSNPESQTPAEKTNN